MRRAVLFGISLAALPLLAQGLHERKPEDVFTLKTLRGGVHALFGPGGNVGFYVGPDAVVVVDSELRSVAPNLVAAIRKATDKPIKYLLNTHHHSDHTGGNGEFLKFAMIVAHDNVRKRMLSSPADVQKQFPALLEEAKKKGDKESIDFFTEQLAWARKVKVEEIPAPFLTFDSEFRIHIAGGETVHVWHTPPAHTDGDSTVFFEKANVAHLGDLFFHRVIPFIDTTAGGSAKGYLAAIDRLLARLPADAVLIPGHGEITDIAGLKGFRTYIADVIAAAAKAKAAGRTKEQFLAEVDLPAYKSFEGYGERFKENAEAAWEDAR